MCVIIPISSHSVIFFLLLTPPLSFSYASLIQLIMSNLYITYGDDDEQYYSDYDERYDDHRLPPESFETRSIVRRLEAVIIEAPRHRNRSFRGTGRNRYLEYRPRSQSRYYESYSSYSEESLPDSLRDDECRVCRRHVRVISSGRKCGMCHERGDGYCRFNKLCMLGKKNTDES